MSSSGPSALWLHPPSLSQLPLPAWTHSQQLHYPPSTTSTTTPKIPMLVPLHIPFLLIKAQATLHFGAAKEFLRERCLFVLLLFSSALGSLINSHSQTSSKPSLLLDSPITIFTVADPNVSAPHKPPHLTYFPHLILSVSLVTGVATQPT